MADDKIQPSRILLADADAFYVAVARLLDPDGAGKTALLVVGGGSDQRGVVTSASYETRAYGVRSGMPMAQALRLCPQATRVPVSFEACGQKSRAIRDTLRGFTPVVEAASIDEFYLDLTGTEALYREPLATTAARIRQTVFDETEIAVSIGGGRTKLLAKLAAKHAKPHRGRQDGVFIVPPEDETQFLSGLDLNEIPGVGPQLRARLAQHGLHAVADALPYEEAALAQTFGPRTGRWLYRRIRGMDRSSVAAYVDPKSLSHEETFARDLHDDEDLERKLLRLSARVASDLRGRGYRGKTITVKLRDFDFTTRQASETLPAGVHGDRVIHECARRLLRRLRKARMTGARLLGVAVSNLSASDVGAIQLTLFDDPDDQPLESERDHKLDGAVDSITQRFGRGGIVRGREIGGRSV